MKHPIISEDIQLLQQGLAGAGISLTDQPTSDVNVPVQCRYFTNPDGTVRWIWSASVQTADFLRFDNASTSSGGLYNRALRVLSRMGLRPRVAQESITLYTDRRGLIWLRQLASERWALFMGSPEPNRKLVVWYESASGTCCFMKLPLSQAAADNLAQEATALRQAMGRLTRLGHVVVPRLITHTASMLVQEDIALYTMRPVNRIAKLPDGPLLTIARSGWRTRLLGHTPYWQQAILVPQALHKTPDTRLPAGLVTKVEKLMMKFDASLPMPVSAAHGDFTPWNVRVHKGRLYIANWQLAQTELPALYDLFHFVYQSTAATGKGEYQAVRQELGALFRRPVWQRFLEKHHLDADQAEQLYLIHTLTYYLPIYSKQTTWTPEIHHLLTIWNDALTHHLCKQVEPADKQSLKSATNRMAALMQSGNRYLPT